MKRKSGFTLIELVVVIVILGILAVTAAPRFLNIQDDAREARLEGMKGAIASGLGIGYGKMAVAGLEGLPYVSNKTPYDMGNGTVIPNQSLPFDGCEKGAQKECVFLNGYPDADEVSLSLLVAELENQNGASDWKVQTIKDAELVYISVRDDTNSTQDKCSIVYGPRGGNNGSYTLRLNHCS